MEDFEKPWIDRLKDKARAQAAECTAIGLIADAEQILADVVRTERDRIQDEGQQYFPGETTSEYGPIVSVLANLEVAAEVSDGHYGKLAAWVAKNLRADCAEVDKDGDGGHWGHETGVVANAALYKIARIPEVTALADSFAEAFRNAPREILYKRG